MSEKMRLIVVSGLSGSGKSVALHILEDLDFYCIDNLPASLLKSLLNEVPNSDEQPTKRIAVGVDARNRLSDLESLSKFISELRESNIQVDVLFLQASTNILLKRYSETRRKHPLANHTTELRTAIANERKLLDPVISYADLVIDTSQTSIYELAEIIRERIDKRVMHTVSILIESFGYKYGIPVDADFVFDLRCLPNPYWTRGLRILTGQDEAVINFLNKQPKFQQMYEDILLFLNRWIPSYITFDRAYLTVALGCTGGQHRSVYMVNKLAAALRKNHNNILIRHNEISTNGNGVHQS